jgi:hypothetical protein
MLCEYGCGNKAKFYFKTVNKWCCSKHFSQCPKRIEMFAGKNNPMYNKNHGIKEKLEFIQKKL